jgi:hypothetical protein
MALALLALAVAGLIIVPTRDSDESRSLGSLLALAALPVLAGLAVLGTAVAGSIPRDDAFLPIIPTHLASAHSVYSAPLVEARRAACSIAPDARSRIWCSK